MRTMRMGVRCGKVLMLVTSVIGCGSESTSPKPGESGPPFRVVAGGGSTDTIEARLLQALIVELRDSTGTLARGKTVRFEAQPPTDPNRQFERQIAVASLAAGSYGTFTTDVTDSLGRAKALIAFGSVAGSARVTVSVPELGRADTVTYTVKPGSPSRMIIVTRDTTVQPGATYSLNASATDRYFNPTPNVTLTFTPGPGIVSVSAAGFVTVGLSNVRSHVTVSWQNVTDTAHVSVIERLRLVGYGGGNVLLVNTDGSGAIAVASSAHASLSPHAVSTTGDVVYYTSDPTYDANVWIVTPGGFPRILVGEPNGFQVAAWPRWSPDGKWVYFVGGRQAGARALWRIRPDGTQADSLGAVASPLIHAAPSISPDGTTAALTDHLGVKLINVASKTSHIIHTPCGNVRHSPDGQRFACVNNGGLWVMNADGTALTARGPAFQVDDLSGVDWSADGKWVVVSQYFFGPHLVNMQDGTVMKLTSLIPGTFQLSFVR